ncbi:MAG TPA: acetate kinase [Bacteroidales bacterium]|nr:acetate kinase [Bacteroidales bacterium]
MKIIVLNCGSSSIKYQLFDMTTQEVLAKGIVEKIGLHGSFIKNERNDGDKLLLEGDIYDHQSGIEYVLGILTSIKHGSLTSFEEIDAVGHRVVHGGEKFNTSVLINDEVIKMMEECIDLAPLHNPPNLKGIFAMQALLPNVPQVGVFDTAFHQTMPDYAYMYAIPFPLYKQYGIRRYGFHGTSHRYVSQRAANILGVDLDNQKVITCHLGNGSSLAAISHGISVDTSMGMTPVEGLIMGTRCGDLDLGVLTYLMMKEELDISTANTLINKHSGMLGITGVSSDMREIMKAADEGNERARLGLNMYAYRIRKYIGSYAAAMGGLDMIVFTGGVGENSDYARAEVVKGLEFLGLDFDFEKNKGVHGQEMVLTKDSSRVKVLVVPTNEELIIAEDTLEIIDNIRSQGGFKIDY